MCTHLDDKAMEFNAATMERRRLVGFRSNRMQFFNPVMLIPADPRTPMISIICFAASSEVSSLVELPNKTESDCAM